MYLILIVLHVSAKFSLNFFTETSQ